LQTHPEDDDLALMNREVDTLRVENRRVMGRINFRKRRGWMFLAFLLLTLAVAITVVVFVLSPTDWAINQQTRFTQMTSLIIVVILATPLAGYFAQRYDRQRERVRVARNRQHEIMHRLAQLDGLLGKGVRRRRRRHSRSWSWSIEPPQPFSRPPLESLPTEELEEAAASLGNSLTEGRALRMLAYAHAAITGVVTLAVAFGLTLAGPEYLTSFVSGKPWGGTVGPDPLLFWLTLTVVLVLFGGIGTHRVSALLRHARAYQDRLTGIERALWDARVLVRERREEV
jgi:hypothetical protein